MTTPQTPVVGHIGPETNEPAPAHEGPADATLPAHSFEAGFNAGGNRTMALLVAELRAADLKDVANQVEKRWHS